MTDILPTHTCFDDALDFISAALVADFEAGRRLVLVHGICRDDAGEPYAHAWVEDGALAHEAGLLDGARVYYCQPIFDHALARRVERRHAYTPREALLENMRSGTYGPWRPELRALCGTGERRVVARYQARGRAR